ncbi:hypothetical protein HN766_11750 [Candidatus Poribacteria bacterium]|nr:hypothetical protein [Candidatus Poribacteria bacterium]
MSVSHALLPRSLRAAVSRLLTRNTDVKPREILESLTDVRRQTAASVYGVPVDHTLRSARVVSPGLTFISKLMAPDDTTEAAKGLLAACASAMRRGGASRNRGRGRLVAALDRQDEFLQGFAENVGSVGER